MFTGIVQGLGEIRSITPIKNGLRMLINPLFELKDPELGESIAVNGVCLTVTSILSDSFSVDVSPETLSRTTLGELKINSKVNLERALRLSDRLGGHIVSGHVDTVGKIATRREQGDFIFFSFELEPRFDKYIIEKGSIAIDGISLTVNSCRPGGFEVAIIPHTAAHTTLSFKKPGDKVNIELDVLGKYIEKLLFAKKDEKGSEKPESGLNKEFLARYGFI